ncbi:class I SAM-dependent methyltransferase [Mucilaginibacter sp.]|uniref:class I SAM-dependent methyltransferase n=1 Tax=Mucilaginibacter sp. TaxID=1882438 RepID=UPI000CBEBFA7|nr:class I SAM-dependent methyltransferase [Mucilaginibacter sp.]PLW88735.1 MAG: SAM-dependent methyltransferase [Mucilaginibacter sp.]PMP65685.1 MAG: SAM-dependent methyltransferase [Mucilaginibacter sp.]HEK20693.1 class I SAM-dependent methyltransferase [Bacteroidota bacterium]
MKENIKALWDEVYRYKTADQLSWTQPIPQTSLNFINSFNLSKNAGIIDIGGGDSKLVDCLLADGYRNITVLDISETALEKAQKRLGKKGKQVKWIVSDVTEFQPEGIYDIWHDRAVFHFLTTRHQIAAYQDIAIRAIANYMIIGTFSENGPRQWSGLPVKPYSENELQSLFNSNFKKIRCINEDHVTPFQTKQNFLFCSFQKFYQPVLIL